MIMKLGNLYWKSYSPNTKKSYSLKTFKGQNLKSTRKGNSVMEYVWVVLCFCEEKI